jgi:class 3 adenylate cyclase
MSDRTAIGRRLAAILAADIAGYSRLMGEDEAGTVRDLKAHQAVVLPLAGRHGGLFLETEPAFRQFLQHTRAFLAG